MELTRVTTFHSVGVKAPLLYRLLVVEPAEPEPIRTFYDSEGELDAWQVLEQTQRRFPGADIAIGLVIIQDHSKNSRSSNTYNTAVFWIHGTYELEARYGPNVGSAPAGVPIENED